MKKTFLKNRKELFGGERIYPGFGSPKEEREHSLRYLFAKKFLKPSYICLDAACGSGYGTSILANNVKKIIGVDISEHAIGFAKINFPSKNIHFDVQDLENLKFPKNLFDVIVSIETFEHVKNQEKILKKFKQILKKNGLLIISTPDATINKKMGFVSPFHINEKTKEEFVEMISSFFRIEKLYGQKIIKKIPLIKKLFRSILKGIGKLDVFKIRSKFPVLKDNLLCTLSIYEKDLNFYPLDVKSTNKKFNTINNK